MRVDLTKQECLWLSDLALMEKEKAVSANTQYPNAIFELRRDNMADLALKLSMAVQRQVKKEKESR